MQHPNDTHWSACKRVMWYLKGTTNVGLKIWSSPHNSLFGYTDADWASNVDDRRSTGGYCIYYGDHLVQWSSKKKSIVALSSTKSKYRALANGAVELLWIQAVLNELRIKLTSLSVLWCDNMSASSLAANPTFHARTKHIEVDGHFMRDCVVTQKLVIRYVPRTYQVAYILTKVLSTSRFLTLRDKLDVCSAPSSLKGGDRK